MVEIHFPSQLEDQMRDRPSYQRDGDQDAGLAHPTLLLPNRPATATGKLLSCYWTVSAFRPNFTEIWDSGLKATLELRYNCESPREIYLNLEGCVYISKGMRVWSRKTLPSHRTEDKGAWSYHREIYLQSKDFTL